MIWKKKTQAFVFTGIFYYFLLYEKADCSKMNSPQNHTYQQNSVFQLLYLNECYYA